MKMMKIVKIIKIYQNDQNEKEKKRKRERNNEVIENWWRNRRFLRWIETRVDAAEATNFQPCGILSVMLGILRI